MPVCCSSSHDNEANSDLTMEKIFTLPESFLIPNKAYMFNSPYREYKYLNKLWAQLYNLLLCKGWMFQILESIWLHGIFYEKLKFKMSSSKIFYWQKWHKVRFKCLYILNSNYVLWSTDLLKTTLWLKTHIY